MRILKINDGFVTNSSSSGVAIIIALQKGKSLKEVINKIGKPAQLPSDFYDFEDISEKIEEYHRDLEVEHLIDEYDILYNSITTEETGGEWYSMPEAQIEALWAILRKLDSYRGKEIILLSDDYWE